MKNSRTGIFLLCIALTSLFSSCVEQTPPRKHEVEKRPYRDDIDRKKVATGVEYFIKLDKTPGTMQDWRVVPLDRGFSLYRYDAGEFIARGGAINRIIFLSIVPHGWRMDKRFPVYFKTHNQAKLEAELLNKARRITK